MRNLVINKKFEMRDMDAFFPWSYDLSDLEGEEFKDFKEDFKFCQVMGFMKQV